MDHRETTSHEQLQAVLDLAGLEFRASEIHGMVCGEICRRLRVDQESDFASLLGVSADEGGAQRSLLNAVEALMEQSHRALDAGMRFSLLLPDDDEPVDERTGSLAGWAHGFVLALLRGNELSLENLGGDSVEIVQDMLKISEAKPGGRDEEDERALAEIEEYMRVGVQLVFEELQPDNDNQAPDRSVH